MKLVLVRHGESEWNRKNLFTGWTDVELSDKGRLEAKTGGAALRDAGFDFDVCYTSYLKRAIHTLDIVLDEMDRSWLPVHKDWHLNERHYGSLQGLNKEETAERFGEEQVHIWRRSYGTLPPLLDEDDDRSPHNMIMYRGASTKKLPLGESLETTIDRVIPYFNKHIKPKVQEGTRVLIVAHGNSLRALVKYFEELSNDEIMDVNIPTGIPLVYEFDEDFHVNKKYYLADEATLKEEMDSVKNQGKSKDK
ncbi:MAG: 2,3-diphosphoglycerate-dependent phosphoglycerate mutase [Erysipelothrix sp.]|nr:2,3-diphosphoglycerate-dependent phosphoglycerate mutase [Erysipelothrix sp.]